MAIVFAYLAQAPTAACEPVPQLQVDLGQPGPPPLALVPLATVPKGPVRRVSSTAVGDFAFVNGRVDIVRDSRFVWRFIGPGQHNVTLANGQVGYSSTTVTNAQWSHRFAQPGVYRLVCSLHPVAMTQIIRVR